MEKMASLSKKKEGREPNEHNKAAVQVKEDMKKLVQLPILRAQPAEVKGSRLFGVSLSKLCEQGLVTEGVPMAVRRMVEHLRIHALHQEGLFRVNGNVRAVETLKQRLENDEDVDFLSEADVCTVASLLKQYLRELPEGLVNSAIQAALLQQHQDSSCSDEGSWSDLRDLLQQLPDVHYSLLRYFCRFLTEVESHHQQNLMTALNLATVFGPSVFHVSPGFEAMKEQNVCNKVMARLIQNYGNIFESSNDGDRGGGTEEAPTLIIVKEVHPMNVDDKFSPKSPKMAVHAKKKQVRKGTSSPAGSPHVRQLPTLVPVALGPRSSSPVIEKMETPPLPSPPCSPSDGMEAYDRSPEDDRPISPFYMSNHLSPVHCRPDVANFLDRTIRAAVQQHLFDINSLEGHGSQDHELPLCNASPVATPNARQRRRRQREQEAESARGRERSRFTSLKTDIHQEKLPLGDKENSDNISESTSTVRVSSSHRGHSVHLERTAKPSKPRHDQDANAECPCVSGTQTRPGGTDMEALAARKESLTKNGLPAPQRLRMKIQESPVICDTGRSCSGEKVRGLDPECENRGDVPRLDLTALSEDNNNNNNWGDPSFFDSPFLDFKSIFQQSYCDEPVPAYSSWQRESMDREEARLSPHAGGRLIRQLMEEGNDPMLSPRFYGYGHSQQYLNDTEVPPSPPNAHSFASRRRSSSLGSCDDEKEELSSAQLSKRIHVLKKKIHRFEEKFEDDRKYRPSHSDKLANPEVLRWVNELAKLRKNLKEHKLLKSEEDLPPLTRQRSNTLPKSFGSQLEKKHQPEKTPLPPAESTLEVVLDKLQEKRAEVGRPEDIKDMTREQIGAEKLALQKALLYYESIHGRPVTKSERQIMKPLYDRYRLVKQILCRASTIPVIGSPSSKRRGPLLQPIIEGVPALFFDDIKEEEDGPEEEGESIPQFTVTDRPNLSMLSFLDQMEEEADGFISPVDELSPSKNTIDMRLSNLHSATMQELVEQLQETREEKKRLRKNLREFEDQFFRENGRNVQKEDRSPLAVEYNEYKHVKAKLRLLEVLISKRDSTKFI